MLLIKKILQKNVNGMALELEFHMDDNLFFDNKELIAENIAEVLINLE